MGNTGKSPKVSVCIPTYNYARYLPEALESVLAQTFTDYELLVIDDHSTDNSAAVIENYARRDDRIVFSVNDRNLGMVDNWNLCLARARGTYVRFLFGDDYFDSPGALGLMVGVLEKYDDVVLVGSARKIVDEHSCFKCCVSRFSGNSAYLGVGVVRRSLLEERNLVGEPSAVMFRRQAAQRGFDPAYRQLVDLEMWFHLLGQGNYYHIAQSLTAFRVHGEQQTVHNALAGVLADELMRLNADYGRRPDVVNTFWRWLLSCQADHRTCRSGKLAAEGRRHSARHATRIVLMFNNVTFRLMKLLCKIVYRHCAARIRSNG